MLTPSFFLALFLTAAISYLLGSINSAIIVSRVHAGDDVRRHGSGNAGMTNILRTYGTGPAVCTALGDFSKAVISVVLGRLLFAWLSPEALRELDAGYIAGLFVLLGHLFPLYFHFKGGKGVMTSLGVILIVNPVAFCMVAIPCIILVFIVKIVSLGSVLGAIAYPFATYAIRYFQGRNPWIDTVCSAIIAVIILYMHRDNIKRLMSGTENKFGGAKKKQ